MLLTIDNLDGAGPRDYSGALAAPAQAGGQGRSASTARIERRLNRPSQLSLSLVADSDSFAVPPAGARIVLERNDGTKLFTGYLAQAPEAVYQGWGKGGPVYRYPVNALGDEFALDLKSVPPRAPFVGQTAGQILKTMADELLPQGFDTTAVVDCELLSSFECRAEARWSELAGELGVCARAAYRAHDAALRFQPAGTTEYLLDETAETFSPAGLQLGSPVLLQTAKSHPGVAPGPPLANDILVVAQSEPCAYVKDYFLGDGSKLSFTLSTQPFTRYSNTFVDEEFTGTALDPLRWKLDNPAVAAVTGGKLQVSGGLATVTFVEQIELGGVLVLQHGDVQFTAASNGMIGGLCAGGNDQAHAFAAFSVAPAAGQSQISVIVNGAPAGTSITAGSGQRYVLTTRVYASEIYRRQQSFHSSLHPAGAERGGAAVPANAHVVMEVHVIDPANPGSQVAASTVLYDGVLANVPSTCNYVLVNAADLHCQIAFTRLTQAVDIEVSSTVPGQSTQTRLVGALSDGAACNTSTQPDLYFYSSYVPAPNEAIRASYRSSGQASARVMDATSIAALARGTDDGVRGRVVRVLSPLPRTSADCENAALALLDDSTQTAWAGTYQTWSDFLPGGAGDVWPGDALHITSPSRGVDCRAIVREVAIDVVSLADDHSRYALHFANDAAESLAFTLGSVNRATLPELTALPTTSVGTTFVADLSGAEMAGVTSTTVTLDTGCDPIPGGGFEVRRSDYGWGMANDRNLIGRFTTRSFTVTRLSRVQTHYLRQYDASGRYSRYSAVLHVDYPL